MSNLYHYCSSNSFASIITGQSIWLSSLSLSNDSKEGKLLNDLLVAMAVEDSYVFFDDGVVIQLQEILQSLFDEKDGYGFCLSQEKDSLSQWRGYADDATGICIGFSQKGLNALIEKINRNDKVKSWQLVDVIYDLNNQRNLITPVYDELRMSIMKGALSSKQTLKETLLSTSDVELRQAQQARRAKYWAFLMKCAGLTPSLYRIKSKAFSEEKEWRIIPHTLNDSISLKYRGVQGKIIPYHELDITPGHTPIITEVILGPKHVTPVHIIEKMLSNNGFKDVVVSQSAASYR